MLCVFLDVNDATSKSSMFLDLFGSNMPSKKGEQKNINAPDSWKVYDLLPENIICDDFYFTSAIYQKSYTRREDLSLLALGEIVCAQFSRDDSWYRARVVDVDAEANTVQVRKY